MKRALIIIISLFVILLAGVAIAPGFIDWNPHKEKIREQVKAHTGYDIQVAGDLSFAILPFPQVFLNDVTVRSDSAGEGRPLLKLERLGVEVALKPLFQGKIDVSAVNLVKPSIYLRVDGAGNGNWMTDKLAAKAAPKDGSAADGQDVSTPDIALSSVSIEDGSLIYEAAGAAPLEIKHIDTHISAQSLKGPFEIKGGLTSSGEHFTFTASAGELKGDAVSVPLKFQITPEAARLTLGFAGVVELGEKPGAQGNTTLVIADAAQYLAHIGLKPDKAVSSQWTMSALVTADAQRIAAKDISLDTGVNKFNGSLDVSLKPLAVTLALASDTPLDLGKYGVSAPAKGKGAAAQKKGDGIATLQGALPATMSLPSALNVDLALSAPGLAFDGQIYEGVTLQAAIKDNIFAGALSLSNIPGNGSAQIAGELRYKGRSQEGSGAVILSEPALEATIRANTQNISESAKAFGASVPSALAGFKTAAVNLDVAADDKAVTLKQSSVALGDMKAALSGSLRFGSSETRPFISLDAAVDTLNLDKVMPKQDQVQQDKGASGAPNGAPADALKALALPYDVDFDLGAQKLITGGQTATGLRAQGSLRRNALSLKSLSVQSYAGAAVVMQAKIADLKNLAGVELTLNAEAKDVSTTAKVFGADISGVPQAARDMKAVLSASGAIGSGLEVKGNVNAAGAQVIFAGTAVDAMSALKLDGLTLQVKHPNAAQAFATFAGMPRYASLAKPLDFYTQVAMDGGKVSLSGIKADVAGSAMNGDISYDGSVKPAALTGKLNFGALDISGAPKGQGSGAASKSKPSGTDARWSSAPIGTQWLHGMNADIDIAAQSLRYETWDLQNPAIVLSLKDGVLNISKLQAGLYGGEFSATGAISGQNQQNAPVGIVSKMRFNNVDIQKLVSSFVGNNRLLNGSGRVSVSADIKTSGISQAALIKTLGGSGSMSGSDIVLEGFDLERFARAMSSESKPGDTVTHLWKSATSGGSTRFDTLDGAFTITGGVVNIDKLDMNGPKAMMQTTGSADLPKWWLDTDHKFTLHQRDDVPPFTVELSGPLDNPAQTLAGGALQNYLQRKLQRKLQEFMGDKLNIPGLGGGSGNAVPQQQGATGNTANDTQQQPPARQQIRPEDAFRSILQGVLQ